MKKQLLVLIAGLLLEMPIDSQAQDKSVLKVNYLSWVVRTASVLYEREVAPQWSGQLGAFYTFSNRYPVNDYENTGFGFTPEVRHYTSKRVALRCFYLGTFLRYRFTRIIAQNQDGITPVFAPVRINTLGGGVLLGYQRIFGRNGSMDFFIGPHYNYRHFQVPATITSDEYRPFNGAWSSPVGLRIGATMGLAWSREEE